MPSFLFVCLQFGSTFLHYMRFNAAVCSIFHWILELFWYSEDSVSFSIFFSSMYYTYMNGMTERERERKGNRNKIKSNTLYTCTHTAWNSKIISNCSAAFCDLIWWTQFNYTCTMYIILFCLFSHHSNENCRSFKERKKEILNKLDNSFVFANWNTKKNFLHFNWKSI